MSGFWTGRSRRIAAVATSTVVLAGALSSPPAWGSGPKVPAKYASGIRVALDASYPPDEFLKGRTVVGFDADLATALGKVMGVKMSLQDATFDTIIVGVESGRYGIGDSSFTDTKAREKQVDFIDYFVAGEGYYEPANSHAVFNGLHALCGHSVAVETGTTEETDANNQAKHCHVHVYSFENQNEANLAVASGKADVGFADSQVAAYIVHLSGGQFKLTGKPFSTAPYGFIVAKNSGLAQPLMAAFRTIMANGQYKKILDKWGVGQGAISAPKLNGATS
ncbi:MAG TPA: ABC transporter substrate-binding protein [Acidimicrobiales bacterium]|nr:ABC transporter substrate-binding protein [Acidimicrobiales bacterium]